MLLLVIIGKGFFPIYQSYAYTVIFLLKQDYIFYMIVNDTRGHGAQSKNPSKMFSLSSSLIQAYFTFKKALYVVATTHHNGTRSLLTSAKLTNGLSRSGDYKRTQQEALTAFIYYIYTWLLVRATTISIQLLSPCCYLMSITHPPCVELKAIMLPTYTLTSYS